MQVDHHETRNLRLARPPGELAETGRKLHLLGDRIHSVFGFLGGSGAVRPGRGKTGSRNTGLARAGGRIASAEAGAIPAKYSPNDEAGSIASTARPARRRWNFNRAVIATDRQSQLGEPE